MNAIPPPITPPVAPPVDRDQAQDAQEGAATDSVRLSMDAEAGRPAAEKRRAAEAAARDVPPDPLPDPWPDAGTGQPGRARARDTLAVPPLLADIEVTLSVEVGCHRLPLSQLLAVEPGQIFALDRMTNEPVSILANGKPFGQGEIVALGERFGIRLLSLAGSDAQ